MKVKLMRFYIYAYVNLDCPGEYSYDTSIGTITFNYKPVYIGKGCGKRIYSHTECSHNENLNQFINDKNFDFFKIPKLSELPSHVSYRIESELIYLIGRRDLNKGPLFNKSAGVNLIEKINKLNEISPYNLEFNKLIHTIKVLNQTKNLREAAKILDISERTIYRIKKDYNIKKIKNQWLQVG